MRGLLIVNPHATTITSDTAGLVTRSLAGLVDLTVEHTRHRGHARELAAAARASRADVVLVLGGDGVVNETVNGVLSGDGAAGPAGPPLIGVIPGGGGNVFARALGLPAGTTAAIARVRQIIAAGRCRTIGLGLAGDRYFTFTAGLGMDAEVVHEVETMRARGSRESPSLFVRAILHRYYNGTNRRTPALTLVRDGLPPEGGLFMTIITNRSPYTYIRGRPLLPVPDPDFSSGLDLLALRRVRLTTIVSLAGRMLRRNGRPERGRDVLSVLGADALAIRSLRPVAFQVDGEYLGETEAVSFRFVPRALRVLA